MSNKLVKERLEYLLSDLFSDEPKEEWGEGYEKPVEGLGYIQYLVEDNAGTITLFVTKEKVNGNPFWLIEEGKEVEYTSFKVLYRGMASTFPKGTLYSKLVDTTYQEKVDFNTVEETVQLLTTKILQLV